MGRWEIELFGGRPGKPNQRKGQSEKFMNFALFCEFWYFSLGKQARFTSNFCSGMLPGKVHELAFLWFGLPGWLLSFSLGIDGYNRPPHNRAHEGPKEGWEQEEEEKMGGTTSSCPGSQVRKTGWFPRQGGFSTGGCPSCPLHCLKSPAPGHPFLVASDRKPLKIFSPPPQIPQFAADTLLAPAPPVLEANPSPGIFNRNVHRPFQRSCH